ncbi:Arylsulfatase A [Lutibacter oricola]|uniref:Arylsulfatase A n=1 Tax=Lutibacter oricola TaxID=762486 RepID=A0A1H2SVL6_9FLAO|nr:arylsulfatase [Lutibacter oricola]SDW35089.1 Arylsulfatase A [Lutibacter oricola]
MKKYLIAACVIFIQVLTVQAQLINKSQPNVIIILTDDQGVGDLGCQGNPWIKTPNIDSFYKESVRLTDFHVSPLCAPTRSAIITGKYPINNGVWATYKGRDALSEGTQTMASVFKQSGYKTAMFGKWHLGDNYPVRPTDVGFDEVVQHKAGGVGELSDYWGNSYFNDVYFVNNEPKQFNGYCTDVWFEEAIKFIKKSKEKPFFIYLSTNAPHSPLIVAEKYAEPYRKLESKNIPSANFYGMIANIDENFGKFDAFLKKEGLADNTILIFMTDNGSGNGVSKDGKLGYNKGFRGKKGTKTEGGHRVPFFIRWPNGKIEGGKDISELTAHVDMLPTLANLCNIQLDKSSKMDGINLSSLLKNESVKLQDRTVFVHHRQDWRPPKDIDKTALLNQKWRLVNGNQLYNIEDDLYQKNNLASEYPEVVKLFLKNNKSFLQKSKLNTAYNELPVAILGSSNQKEITLTIQHAIGDSAGIWKAEQVSEGFKSKNNTHALKIEKAGLYKISCRRWPKECAGPILGVPLKNPKGGMYNYKQIKPKKVRIQIANQLLEKEIFEDDEEVFFNVNLEKGKTLLVTDFIEGKEKYGVYYTYISLKEN